VIFCLIDAKRLPWGICEGLLREIAVEAAELGPFRLRAGSRNNGGTYWVGFNCTAAADALASRVGKALKRRTNTLEGGNPQKLDPVLSDRSFRNYAPDLSDEPDPVDGDWSPASPAPTAASQNYRDCHYATVILLLDLSESNMDSSLVLETIKDLAVMLWQTVGAQRPFAVRCAMQEEPGRRYRVALNSSGVAGLLEEALTGKARVISRGRPRDGKAPLLRLAVGHPGVPEYPVGGAPVVTPPPEPDPIEDFIPPDLSSEPEDASPQERAKYRRARAIAAKAAAALSARMRRRPKRPRKWAPRSD